MYFVSKCSLMTYYLKNIISVKYYIKQIYLGSTILDWM